MRDKELHPGTVAFAWTPYAQGGGGTHPVIVVSCEEVCASGSEVLAVPGSSNLERAALAYHYEPDRAETGLPALTRFKCEQMVPICRENIRTVTGRISRFEYMKLQACLLRALHLESTDW